MLLGFDAKRAFQNSTGLGNYSRDVLRVLARHYPEHRYLAYGPRLVAGRLADGVEPRGPDGALGRFIPSLWRVAGLAAQAARDGVEIFHGLSNELPLGLERTGVRSVVSIHDLIFERFPSLYRPVDRRIYRWKSRSASQRADLVVAVSEQTRRDLVELYRIDPARIRVVYQGCHTVFQAAPDPAADQAAALRLGLPERYLLNVGTVERRKNLMLAVRALPALPGLPLLVAGRETPYAAEVRAEAARLGVAERLRFLGAALPLADLAVLYRRCSAFVYPSIFEGFGIPIIEALFCGAPVVTTAGGVFPEAGGAGACYVDPADHQALAATLAGLLADPARREGLRRAGLAHVERFTDRAVAGALMAVYQEAMA
jgi:glycosyltransferase involved in cell wall biosynthesis